MANAFCDRALSTFEKPGRQRSRSCLTTQVLCSRTKNSKGLSFRTSCWPVLPNCGIPWRWKQADLQATGQNLLSYLPASAVIHAKVFPGIKPGSNSFVWESSTNPAIFLYLDPDVSAAKFTNTVAHELHHIGLASAQADYDARIQQLPERVRTAAEWVGAFGEGLAMLAAAGSVDTDPHVASSKEEHARWERDLANFNTDLPAVNAFFMDILGGKFTSRGACSSFTIKPQRS